MTGSVARTVIELFVLLGIMTGGIVTPVVVRVIDVSIEIIGPRPGEKLQEELFNERESPVPTGAERILKADRPPLDPEWVEGVFDQVERLVADRDEAFLADRIAELVKQPGHAMEALLEPAMPAQRASSGGEAT